MAADLRETQENQGVSENRIDKPELLFVIRIHFIRFCGRFYGHFYPCR